MARHAVARAVLGASLTLAAAVSAAGVFADRPTEVPGEMGLYGITPEEYAIRQQQLHVELMSQVPPGVLASPQRVQLSAEDRAELQRPRRRDQVPLKVGVVKPLPAFLRFAGVDPAQLSREGRGVAGGVLQRTEDGFVWAIAVASEGAQALRVHVDGARLPAGTDLHILNMWGEAYGPYVNGGPSGTGDFWTHSVGGGEAVVILRYAGPSPAEALRQTAFSLVGIGHIQAGEAREPTPSEQAICGNPNCILDASCYSGGSQAGGIWNAIAKMEWIAGAFIYTCSGGLLADTDTGTQIPLFLTANHCLSRDRDAQNLELFWFYRTSTCSTSSCPNDANFPRTLGATVLASGSAGDFTLLRLTQTPPTGTTFLGWTSAAIANTNNATLKRVSHPNFGAQTYAEHQVDTGAQTCSGWPRGERIYSRDTLGATDGGSSGSPVVNSSNQVVGQLSGSCGFNVGDPCDAESNATVDGALAHYYSSVAAFLDPGTGGCTPSAEVCTGGLDEDCDGFIDCADSNCAGSPSCGTCEPAGSPCASGSECCSGSCKGKPGSRTCR